MACATPQSRSVLRSLAMGLMATSTAWAENWQNFEVWLNPGRAGHSFSLIGRGGASAAHWGLEIYLGSQTRISIWSDSEQPFTLVDDTVGDRLEWSIASGYDLRLSNWHWPEDELGQTTPTMRQYFLIGEDRANHGFLLGQPGGSFYVAQPGQPIAGTAGMAGGARRELSSSFSPWVSGFWIIDLNTQERSPTHALDLASLENGWVHYTGTLPTLFARYYMEGAEAGNTFTLHARAPGGSEHLQSVVVEPLVVPPGSWDMGGDVLSDGTISDTIDHTGAAITIPPGNGFFRAHVGLGMEFWLTRDADGASSPVHTALGSGYPQWDLRGAFPPLQPQTIRFDVRVPASSSDQWMAYFIIPDGSGSYLEESHPITIETWGTFYSYDDYGQVDQTLDFASGHVEIPAGRSLGWLYNPSNNEIFYGSDAFLWTPTHAQPPGISPNSRLVTLFGGRKDHQFSVRQQDAGGNWSTTHSFVPTDPHTAITLTNDYGASFSVDIGQYFTTQRIVQHATQGNLSLTSTGAAWWTSYYCRVSPQMMGRACGVWCVRRRW